MEPLYILTTVTAVTLLLGATGLRRLRPLRIWHVALRVGLAAMFTFTGIAHFGAFGMRDDLVAMVPRRPARSRTARHHHRCTRTRRRARPPPYSHHDVGGRRTHAPPVSHVPGQRLQSPQRPDAAAQPGAGPPHRPAGHLLERNAGHPLAPLVSAPLDTKRLRTEASSATRQAGLLQQSSSGRPRDRRDRPGS